MKFSMFHTIGLLAIVAAGCNDKGDPPWEDWEPVPEQITESCGGVTYTAGSHMGYGGYADSTASSGAECECNPAASTTDNSSYYISQVVMSGVGIEPKLISADAPWGAVTGKNPNTTSAGWEYRINSGTSSGVDLSSSSWMGWVSVPDSTGNPRDCSDYGAPKFTVDLGGVAAGPPAPLSNIPDEDENDCIPGAPVGVRVRLGLWPGASSAEGGTAVPIRVGPASKYAGTDIRALQVVDWKGASTITLVERDGTEHQLVKGASSTLTFPAGDIWYGRDTFDVALADYEEGMPELQINGVCPASRPVVERSQGYAFHLGDVLPTNDSQRYIARIVPDATDSGVDHLMVEIDGTAFARGISMTPTGPDTWSIDYQGTTDGLTVVGDATRTATGIEVGFDTLMFGDSEIPVSSLSLPLAE